MELTHFSLLLFFFPYLLISSPFFSTAMMFDRSLMGLALNKKGRKLCHGTNKSIENVSG